MSAELYWLTLTALATALMWVPYILNRIAVRGLLGALGVGASNETPHADWAERAIKGHANAVENLVVFAPVALTAHLLGVSTSVTATAAAIFFFARIAHYIVYITGLPVLRTPIFAAGSLSTVAIALSVLGWI